MGCDLNLSPDQRQIIDAAADMLAAHYPMSRLRKDRADSLTPIADFGGFALFSGEDGFTVVEEVLLHTLFGRHLVSPDVIATALAARSGSGPACCAIASGDGFLTTGAGPAVAFGPEIALVDWVIPAEAVPGLGHGPALNRIPQAACRITAAGQPLRDHADLLIAAHLLGVAEGARDAAVAYARTREQFGRPIGAFQAIKHHSANMAIAAESLSAQLDMAAIAYRDGWQDAALQIAALRLIAPRVALENARACVQIHGGIGFSAEADAHHFVKRAHFLGQMMGRGSILDHAAPLAPLRQREGA